MNSRLALLAALVLSSGVIEAIALRRHRPQASHTIPAGVGAIAVVMGLGSMLALILLGVWFLDNVVFEMPGW